MPQGDRLLLTDGVTWSSSNTGVATIDSAGWATTQNPGTTTISASWSRTGYTENPDQCEPQFRPAKDVTEVQPLSPACGTCLTFHARMNVNVGYQVTACDVTIQEETISPGDGTLPVRNPAQIRRLFAPVFEATVTGGSASACPVNWIVAGPGSIVGAANNPLLTVNGNSVGSLLLKVTTYGGRFADLIVPVVNQREVEVRVWIVRETNGTGAAATQNRVDSDIAMVNNTFCSSQVGRIIRKIAIQAAFTVQPHPYDSNAGRFYGAPLYPSPTPTKLNLMRLRLTFDARGGILRAISVFEL